jgi:glycosyltransferase involved in cell wall biosynthesis
VTSVSLDASAVPAEPQGAGRYVVELARALGARGSTELTILTRRSDGERWRALAPRARVLAVVPNPRPARLLYEQAALGRVVSGQRRPAVQVHHGPHYTMPRLVGLPAVVTVHDLTFFDHPEWHDRTKARLFRHATRLAARRAAVVVCVSRATERRLTDLLDPRCPTIVVPHGVDHGRFRPGGEDDDSILRRLGVAPATSGPYVIHLGTIEPRKDVPSLVRAFDEIAAGTPTLRLVLAGSPAWGAATLGEAIRAARHASRVVLLGYVPEAAVPALLRQAAVVAYPSIEEGFGLPALEAMACGTPLVTTVGSAMAETADGAALLVPAGDVPALAVALGDVLSGGAAVEARRRRGLEVAAAYTWERSAEGHERAYELAALGAAAAP